MVQIHGPRQGVSLPELILVLTLIALVSIVGVHALHSQLDHVATRDAVRAAGALAARARDEAVAQHTPVSLRIDTTAAALDLVARGTSFGRIALGNGNNVSLSTNRDSITFDVRGLGYGAANLTLVARRGASSDTLVISRLGRVRY